MAEQTIDPELTEVNLTNTTDFLKAFTDYNEHVNKFAKEIAVANVYQHTDVTVDPITDKAQLFFELATNSQSIKDDNRGSKDKKGKPESPVKASSTGLNKDMEGFDDEFLAYWLEKYRLLHPVIQQECEKLIGAGGGEYFKDVSESIGCLTETDFIDDDRVLPFFDVSVKQYDPPMVYNSKLHNKLSTNTQLINLKFSKLINANSRMNLKNIINGPNSHKLEKDSSLDAHGNNLITDFEHRNRMGKIVTELVTTLQKQYKDLWRFIDWLQTREPESSYKFKKIKLDVEDVKINVDILKNKLYKTKKEMTNNCVLSVDCEDKFERTKRKTKEKAEDAEIAAKRLAADKKQGVLARLALAAKEAVGLA